MKKALCLLVMLFAGTLAFGQGSLKTDIVLDSNGKPVPFATIAVCAYAAIPAVPCTPLTGTTFSDVSLSTPLTNPLVSDAQGNYKFFALPGYYSVQITYRTLVFSYPVLLPVTQLSQTNASNYATLKAALDATVAGGTLYVPENYTGTLTASYALNRSMTVQCGSNVSSLLRMTGSGSMFTGSGVVAELRILNCNLDGTGVSSNALTAPSYTGPNDWSQATLTFNENLIHGFTSFPFVIGQSVYFGMAEHNFFYDNNGGMDVAWASDWMIMFNAFGFITVPGVQTTNAFIRTRGGSKFFIEYNDFENNGNSMAQTTPDVYIDACATGGSSGWIYDDWNKHGGEGEPSGSVRPKILIANSCGSDLFGVERIVITHNQFSGFGNNVGYALQLQAVPEFLLFDENWIAGMHTVINDAGTLTATNSVGFAIYGCQNQVQPPLSGFGTDNTYQVFANGGQFFQHPCKDPRVSDNTLKSDLPTRETLSMNNRITNSTFVGAGAGAPWATNWSGSSVAYASTITAISRAGTTVSVTTAACTSATVNFWTTVTGVTDGVNFPNGNKLVVTAPDCNHFTYTEAGAAVSSSSGSVTVYLTKITPGQADPDGGTNAILVERAGKTAFENINNSFSLAGLPKNVAVRFCVKAGTLAQVQSGILRSDTQKWQGSFQITAAGSGWGCDPNYDVRGIDTTKVYSWAFYPGDGEANTRAGSIYLYAPQVSDLYGDYEPTSGTAVTSTNGTRFNRPVELGANQGTAPLVVTSTTRVANLTMSNHATVLTCGTTATCSHTALAGTQIVWGSAPLVSATPSAVTITGISPVFTSTTSFVCTVSNATTAADGLKVVNTSTSSITITGPNTVTDTVNFVCVGN